MAKQRKDWQCLECERRMTQRQAERIVMGGGRCTCGGCDIDLYTPGRVDELTAALDRRTRCSGCGSKMETGGPGLYCPAGCGTTAALPA